MISKKILALVLAISVIVCALPAFSVSAEEVWPDVDEAVVNPTVWFNNGINFCIENASNELKASITDGRANTGGMKISGTVTFGDDVITLNNFTIRSSDSKNNTLNGWGSDFICHDAAFKAKLAASDAPGLERDDEGNVIIASSGDNGKVCMRNFVRYMLNKAGTDYSTYSNDTLASTAINATAASLTVHSYTVEFFKNYPAGSLFLPTTTDYLKQDLTSDFEISNKMYVPVKEGAGVGPYAIYEMKDAGEYDVWILKRDQYSDPNTSQRDIYLDINGTTFMFTNVDGAPASVNDGYYLSPEDNGTTLKVNVGDKVFVQLNNKTSVWSGSYGLLLVPTDASDDVEITGKMHTESSALAGYTDNVANGLVKYITPAIKTVKVTVGDTELEVNNNVAETWYPATSKIDKNGQYIEDVTLLDVIIAATEAGVEFPFELVQEITSDKVTPVTYDTTVASGNPWPTHTNGNGYNNLWAGAEIFCTNSSTAYETTVKAPKAGNYWFFTNIGAYDTRYMTFTVNGAAVYEAENDTKFALPENNVTDVVAKVPVALNEGENTVTIKANGGWMRMSYLGFVEADTYEDAVAIVAEITASKEAFNNYYALSGDIYNNGAITNYKGGFSVNDKIYDGNLEYVLVPDGAVIDVAAFDASNFLPVKAAMSGSFYGGRWSSDHMYNDTTDYSNKFISSATFPFDAHAYDALAGCYLNGYVTITTDFTGQAAGGSTAENTTGDDTVSKVFIRDLPIRHTKGNGSTIHLGINTSDAERWGMGGVVSADLDGDGTLETYMTTIQSGIGSLYDTSNLYITNSQSGGPLEITKVDKGNGVYNLTCNKSVPVCFVKVTKVDGVVTDTSFENTFIDFMDKDGIDVTVADNQTVYVWEGTSVPQGTIMVPLCAPLTK